MNPDKTLLFIGATTKAVRTAKDFGLNVILVQHKSKFDPEQAKLARRASRRRWYTPSWRLCRSPRLARRLTRFDGGSCP